MLKAALLLLSLVLAREASAQAPRCAAHERELSRLIGLTEPEAISALEAMPGVRLVRIAAPGAPLTKDYRQERATLLIREGRVVDVTCG